MASEDQLVHLELNEQTHKLHICLNGLEYTLALIDSGPIQEGLDLALAVNIVVEGRKIDRAVTADHANLFGE